MQELELFSYEISRNQSFLIAALSGKIQQSSLESFSQFQREILEAESLKAVLFDFSHVSGITLDAIPALVLLQKNLRHRGLQFRLCGLHDPLKDKLSKLGVIRSSELSLNRRSALESILEGASIKAS